MHEDQFRLLPGTVERVIDEAFGHYRERVKQGGVGFDARSLVNGWLGDEVTEDLADAQVIVALAYRTFIDDRNLYRPAQYDHHKGLLAIAAGPHDAPLGVAMTFTPPLRPGLLTVSTIRTTESIYPDRARTWAESVDELHHALQTMVDLANELLDAIRYPTPASG